MSLTQVKQSNIDESASQLYGMRNRIINGDMRIDQRNAGASYTNSNQSLYGLDRWRSYGVTSAVLTVQQSTTAPVGFSNSQSVTVTTSTTANDGGGLSQLIEGNNVFDLAWGTSSGVAVTASFWVRASVIGTYNIYLRYIGSTATYYYVATYTVNVANTWEQKTINIEAPPVGAGAFTAALNTAYLEFRPVFSSSGNTTTVAANTWSTTNASKTAGCVDFVSNSGATFYITGVQLEAGSVATPFDHRQFGQELALCQRYLPAWNFNSNNQPSAAGLAYSTTGTVMNLIHPVQTRVPPTGISVTGTFNSYNNAGGNAGNFSSITLGSSQGTYSSIINCTGGSSMTQGNATILLSPSGTSQILLTGCEL
jgi:hypothetical protein